MVEKVVAEATADPIRVYQNREMVSLKAAMMRPN